MRPANMAGRKLSFERQGDEMVSSQFAVLRCYLTYGLILLTLNLVLGIAAWLDRFFRG